jgi:hypothetical protein
VKERVVKDGGTFFSQRHRKECGKWNCAFMDLFD